VDDGHGNMAALETVRVEMGFENGRPVFNDIPGSE
jgi:hypothetical protein